MQTDVDTAHLHLYQLCRHLHDGFLNLDLRDRQKNEVVRLQRITSFEWWNSLTEAMQRVRRSDIAVAALVAREERESDRHESRHTIIAALRDAFSRKGKVKMAACAMAISVSKAEMVEAATLLFAPLASDDCATSSTEPTKELFSHQNIPFLMSVFTEPCGDEEGTPVGLKWVRFLDPVRDIVRLYVYYREELVPAYREALARYGALRVMQQPRETTTVGERASLEAVWRNTLSKLRYFRELDKHGQGASLWPKAMRRYEYRRLQHYFSIDRFFMRRRLRNATTHARVLNRHVIDHILEFVFGVFSTRRNFFRDHFTVTRVRGTADDVE